MSGFLGTPRTREEDATGRALTERSMWWHQPATGPSTRPTNVAFSLGPLTGLKRSMSDWVVPGFKKRSSRGEIFNSPMTSWSLVSRIDAATGPHFRYNYTGGATDNGELEGCTLGGLAPSSVNDILVNIASWCQTAGVIPPLETMRSLASTQARAAVKASDFEGLVSLGELRETLRYLRNPFKTGIALADRLNSKLAQMRPSKVGRVSDDIASLYLEFRYGVRPLVKEVESALLTLEKDTIRPLRQTARGNEKWRGTGSITNANANASGIAFNLNIDIVRETSVRAGILYENIVETGLADQWGLRLSDIPGAAWELYPLSFVADWAFNIGDFINAITPKAGTRGLASWYTESDVTNVTVVGSNYRLPIAGWNTIRAGSASVHYVHKSRTRVTQLPSATLAYRGLDNLRNDALRLLDLVGIFGQRLGSVANNSVVRQNERDLMERFAARKQKSLSRRPGGTRAAREKAAESSWLNAS